MRECSLLWRSEQEGGGTLGTHDVTRRWAMRGVLCVEHEGDKITNRETLQLGPQAFQERSTELRMKRGGAGPRRPNTDDLK